MNIYVNCWSVIKLGSGVTRYLCTSKKVYLKYYVPDDVCGAMCAVPCVWCRVRCVVCVLCVCGV